MANNFLVLVNLKNVLLPQENKVEGGMGTVI
jgi:hypothetical protein